MEKKEFWDPKKSKWKAAFDHGFDVNLDGYENILYLGASSGTTVSYLSEYTHGLIFAVEKASTMAIPLIRLAQEKKNIAPIFGDAQDIDFIKKQMQNVKVDILFQDIPSYDQIDILVRASKLVDKNCKIFLSLKTQSISQDDFNETVEKTKKKLKEYFRILDDGSLEPFHKKHWFFVLKKLE